MNPKKLIFAVFFIINPVLYLILYPVLQHINNGSLLESISDALSVIAIYSIGISALWLISEDKLEEAIKADMKAKEENQS